MSDEREELAGEIAGHPIGSGYYSTLLGIDEARELADLILAAGWRKPSPPRFQCDFCHYPDDNADMEHWRCSLCGSEDSERSGA